MSRIPRVLSVGRAVLALLVLLTCPAAAQTARGIPSVLSAPPAEANRLQDESQPPEAASPLEQAYQRMSDQSWDATQSQDYSLGHASLSWSVPALRSLEVDPTAARFNGRGDATLELTTRLVDTSHFSLSPKLGVVLPTGDTMRGVGKGALALQLNLPFRCKVSNNVDLHVGFGMTAQSGTLEPLGTRRNTFGSNASAGLVYRPSEGVELMLEALFVRDPQVAHGGDVFNRDTLLISPAVRLSLPCRDGSRVIPSLAFPIGIGACRGRAGVFFSLTVEAGK